MRLGDMQREFSRNLGLLIIFAYVKGYQITLGDARAKTGHKNKSFHYKGLAIDLNLFKNGKYLRKTGDHIELGEFWESLGGTWGGRFNDGNHYSWGE